jgi:hypothetical protein
MTVVTGNVRWRSVLAGLALGELVAAALLLIPVLGLSALHLAPLSTAPRHRLFEWPFAFDGPWSAVTDLSLLGLLAAAGGVVVARAVSATAGRPVSTRRTALVLFLAGGVPLAWTHGFVPGPVLGFLAAAAGIRTWAVGRIDTRPSRAFVVAAIAVTLVLAGSAWTYAGFHPLRITGSTGQPAGLVVGSNSPFVVEIVGVAATHGGPARFGFDLAPVHVRLAPRSDALVLLHQLPCARGVTGNMYVQDVHVTYRVLGRVERQTLPLSPRLDLHCP